MNERLHLSNTEKNILIGLAIAGAVAAWIVISLAVETVKEALKK